MLSAEVTNSATNLLHAVFLGGYFAASLKEFHSENPHFLNPYIPLCFGMLFFLKIIGMYVHYFHTGIAYGWVAIGLGVFLLIFSCTKIIKMPLFITYPLLVFAGVCSAIHVVLSYQDPNSLSFFYYTALSLLVSYSIFGLFARSYVRAGFFLSVLANLGWMWMRHEAYFCTDMVPHANCNYDNDIYHFVLIGATFLVYYGILQGNLEPIPKNKK